MDTPDWPEGKAIIYCQNAFNTTNGKTAHGLVRLSRRYTVLGVIDAGHAGRDAGQVLDGIIADIPIYANLAETLADLQKKELVATHFVVGLAPDGGRLRASDREAVLEALASGLNVDAGLHDFLSEDSQIAALAADQGLQVRDIRKPPPRDTLHFFSGKIEQVDALTVAVLGTDSAVGKRTTAWLLAEALCAAGHPAEMVGTGQTAWLQGARHSVILDSLVNDFVSGEIEHAVWSAWQSGRPEAIIIEGQGSLMNPAYPGGFEILAAGRPDIVILQHAPTRKEYDGFPGYAIHSLPDQIRAVEWLSGKPVTAVTINHEGLADEQLPTICRSIFLETGRPAFDCLADGATTLAAAIIPLLPVFRQ